MKQDREARQKFLESIEDEMANQPLDSSLGHNKANLTQGVAEIADAGDSSKRSVASALEKEGVR